MGQVYTAGKSPNVGWLKTMQQFAPLELSLNQGSLAQRLALLLDAPNADSAELPFSLDDLSLALGLRLPDLAQTATFWQRGDLGKVLRRRGYGVRVEFGRVIFVAAVRARPDGGLEP